MLSSFHRMLVLPKHFIGVPLYAINLVFFIFVLLFGKPSGSNFSGNIRRNVASGSLFPWALVSILKRSPCIPLLFSILI